jgi:hypothetical protein
MKYIVVKYQRAPSNDTIICITGLLILSGLLKGLITENCTMLKLACLNGAQLNSGQV